MNPEEHLEQYREFIQRLRLEKVSFPVIVEAATERTVESFDVSGQDKELVEELSRLARYVTGKCYNQPIKKTRINEVSNFLEVEVPKVFREKQDNFRIIKDVKRLGGAGYPDIKVKYVGEKAAYLDIKATMSTQGGGLRAFYFTPLTQTKKKLDENGKHAILAFVVERYENGFRTVAWKLVDLSRVKVKLKPEFNADSSEIYNKKALVAEGDWQV